jgi:methyl-accepting chemotaxis protein
MENLNVFIALTTAAIALQALVLLGIFLALRKTSAKVDSLTTEMRTRALPAIESAQSLITTSAPKLEEIVGNVHTATTLVRGQVERLDHTVNDIIDRTRLQVIRADELVTRTLDRVEDATDAVQHTVVSPVRQLTGIMQGVSVGLGALFRARNRRRYRGNGMGEPQDEMFI